MKTLFLVRHAKSSWDHPGLRDHDRPLNERGHRIAPLMATTLQSLGVAPDALVSSPAKRAFSTAEYFAKAFGKPVADIEIEDDIYEAMPLEIFRVIRQLNAAWDTVLLFGHNPTFTEVANHFYAGNRIDNMPTCGIVKITAPVEDWRQFERPAARVSDFWWRKQLVFE